MTTLKKHTYITPAVYEIIDCEDFVLLAGSGINGEGGDSGNNPDSDWDVESKESTFQQFGCDFGYESYDDEN